MPKDKLKEESQAENKLSQKHQISPVTIIGFSIVFILALIIIILGIGMYRVSRNQTINVTTREQPVTSNFNKITLNKFGKVIIAQGDKESLKIEADQNVIDKIVTSVSDNCLAIDYSNSWWWNLWWPNKDIKFYGSGEIISSSITTVNLTINISGSGDADLSVIAKKISSTISGAGNIAILGSTVDQDIKINGTGDYGAKNLQSKNATISINGAGNVKVAANAKLNVTIIGTGNVSYLGNPEVSQNMTGTGKIERISN